MTEADWRLQAERRLNALETRTAVDEVHRAMVEKRLHSIEDTLKWLVRLVIGSLVLGVIGVALRGGFAGV
ncbi:pseudouridine synthase [Rhodovulum sp. 12E13]|uniref:pseudouridine synthase n=1 Tax=Rhodovulum sp. 12E13 TaxID=2203891 RepID=UPI000E18A578|nr:pseudouridine synthase [Rhodovulum sp. 12E13]RDC74335.1 pseudouridine synthase [Rhodovulum sp. 12E13]